MISFTIPRKVASQNDTMWKHWRAYTAERDAWLMLIRSRLIPRHRAPLEKVHASILSKRHRLLDYGNLVGGAKPIPDVLKKLGYIVDDNPRWFECAYTQEQTEGAEETVIHLWLGSETAPDPREVTTKRIAKAEAEAPPARGRGGE